MRLDKRHFVIAACAASLICLAAANAHALGSKEKSPEEEKSRADKEAVEIYNRGVAVQEEAVRHLTAGDSLRSRNVLGKAGESYKSAQKKFQEAANLYEKSVAMKPELAEAHSNLGYCRRNLGDYEGALVSYERALKLKPDFAEALEYRGVALLSMGRREEALKDLERLRTIDPDEAAELEEAIEAADRGWRRPW